MSSRESKWELMALNVTRGSSSRMALPQHPQPRPGTSRAPNSPSLHGVNHPRVGG